MPWRVFPWDPAAQPGEPFSSSYIHPSQGSGRFDIPRTLVVYLAETAVHAVAEKLQRFRGLHLERKDLVESGKPLALVEASLENIKLVDLCDPAVLVKYRIAPDVLASRQLIRTQQIAIQLHEAGFAGLRWWSALSGDWHTIVVFQGAIGYGQPEPLTLQHAMVVDATMALGIGLH